MCDEGRRRGGEEGEVGVVAVWAWRHPESEPVDESLGILRAAERMLESVEDRAEIGVQVPNLESRYLI